MSAPAVTPLPSDANKLAANQSIVRGRILEVKSNENGCYTVIVLPAPDQYSKPETIEVRSRNRLGRPQDDVTVRVSLGGYRRSYKNGHGETEYATNVFLRAVEE